MSEWEEQEKYRRRRKREKHEKHNSKGTKRKRRRDSKWKWPRRKQDWGVDEEDVSSKSV